MAEAVGSAIAAAFFTAGASNAVVTALAVNAAVVGTVAITAASVGYGLYQQSQYKNALTNVNNDQGVQQTVRQAIPPQRLALGTPTAAGALFFWDRDPPYYYQGFLLAAHECDGLDSVFINGTRISLDENGNATSAPFNDGSKSFIQVSFRDGNIDQAIDPILAADFPNLPSTFRQRGHCTAVIKAEYAADREAQEELYGSSFQPLFRFRGAKVYDPRDPSQVLADRSTYKWSDNASLLVMEYLRWKWPHIGERITWELVAVAADIDDEWGFTKEGVAFRKHTINGIAQSNESAFEVVRTLLSANSGKVIIDNGKIYPLPSQRKNPVGTLHDGMIKGGFNYSAGRPFGESINVVNVEFSAPERDNKIVTGPVIRDTDAITADGVEREATVRVPFTETHQRAQMIARRSLKEARLQKSLQIGVTLEAMAWNAGDVITVDLQGDYAQMNGTYEILSRAWDDEMAGYSLSLIEYSQSVQDYNPANDELDFTLDQATVSA